MSVVHVDFRNPSRRIDALQLDLIASQLDRPAVRDVLTDEIANACIACLQGKPISLNHPSIGLHT